jgi:hypothetical protein
MKEGMLWYDSQGGKNIAESISSAIEFFTNKYGTKPQECYLNPSQCAGEVDEIGEVKIVPSEKMIENHIWLEFPAEL